MVYLPWTPESALAAEKLPCPKIGDCFDAKAKLGDVTLKQKRFSVAWAGFANPEITIDPIVELWRPINEQLRVDTDLNLGIFKHGPDRKTKEGETIRTYEVSYGPIERSNVSIEHLMSEADQLVPAMLETLTAICDGWTTADNGMVIFLKEKNKSSMDEYLIGIGIKKRKTPPLPPKKRPSKEERRQAYLKAHPEHANTAQPRHRPKKKP